MTFKELLLKYYIAAWDKQMALADMLNGRGNPDWQFEMDSGKLSFGKGLSFDAQILGSESEYSGTWLWAWANTESNIPSRLLKAALKLRQHGEQHHIPELTTASLSLDEVVNGHHLAMITSMLLKGEAYYRGPYPGGAVFLLIHNAQALLPRDCSATHIVSALTRFVASTPIWDLPRACGYYLASCGMKVSTEENSLTGEHTDGSRVVAEFDKLGRLINLVMKN